jgi:hypothetical protein
MVFQAALVAARPNSSLKTPRTADPAWRTHHCGCLKPSFPERRDVEIAATVVVLPHAGNLSGEGIWEFLPSRIPSSVRVHASGLSCALRLGVVLLRLAPPCGLRFPSSTDPP